MKRHIVACIACLMLLVLAGPASGALTFQLDFGQDGSLETEWKLFPTEGVLIDLYVSNAPEPGLQSMGFDFVYDPAAIRVEAGTGSETAIGTNWFIPGPVETSPGVLQMTGGRIGGLVGDNIKLATIDLSCLAPTGITELFLFDSDRGGTYDDFVLVDGTLLDGDLAGGIKLGEINQVPIPGAIWILGSGLVALVGLRRRFSS